MNTKLLILVSRYRKNIEDSGTFTTEISQWISKKGIEVSVLAPHDYGLKFYEKISGVKIYRFILFPYKYQRLAYGAGIGGNFKTSLFAKFQLPFYFIFEFILSKNY